MNLFTTSRIVYSTALCFILFSTTLFAQVGIGTTSPTETLEVNGSLKVTNTTQGNVTTTKMAGLNNTGNLRDIALGLNLTLKNNILSAKSAFDHSFGSVSFTVQKNNNVDLLLDSGEANFGKSIIRIYNSSGKTEITGIKDGYDGQHIWVYAQDDEIKFLSNDVLSSVINRIEANDKLAAKQWAMIELVYDGTRSKWIVIQNHR